jgi:hypothetical protein
MAKDQQQELEEMVRQLRAEPLPPPTAAPPQPEPDPRILHRLYPEGVRKKMEDRQKQMKELEKELRKKTSSDIGGGDFYLPAYPEPTKVKRKTSWWI